MGPKAKRKRCAGSTDTEAPHGSLALPRRLIRVFCSIVQAVVLAMFGPWHDLQIVVSFIRSVYQYLQFFRKLTAPLFKKKITGVPLILARIVDQHIPHARRYFREQIEPQIDGQQIKCIGPVGPQDKIDLLSRARGMLNPIQWEEPFGMVMVEAMATGCPVIAFLRGAAQEIITSDRVGFLVNDVAEMVGCIQRIDEIDRETVRLYTKEHFSSRAMAENYTNVYKRMIRQRPKLLMPFFSTTETAIPLVTMDMHQPLHKI